MIELGYNYRITDIQCALGLSQLKKLKKIIEKRRKIALYYDKKFSEFKNITPHKLMEEAKFELLISLMLILQKSN